MSHTPQQLADYVLCKIAAQARMIKQKDAPTDSPGAKADPVGPNPIDGGHRRKPAPGKSTMPGIITTASLAQPIQDPYKMRSTATVSTPLKGFDRSGLTTDKGEAAPTMGSSSSSSTKVGGFSSWLKSLGRKEDSKKAPANKENHYEKGRELLNRNLAPKEEMYLQY